MQKNIGFNNGFQCFSLNFETNFKMPGKKKGSNFARQQKMEGHRELIFKGDCQVYGKATQMLGNCRLHVECFDGVVRLCSIKGSMAKKPRREGGNKRAKKHGGKTVFINKGDVVLVSLMEFGGGLQGQVIHKYIPSEVKKLQEYGEVPPSAGCDLGNDEQIIIFDSSSEEEEEED